ncbi:hypothetical protein GIB67_028845 [Kingdonia uniflora]|uniref:Uncharacterized protein n=1 Tax=Kingdonia uniflora TaxID=39325 RepID=A0A7J7LTK4_9MAGN|nr:hypothetical protein GIB67_028845 [Kingdonia uniflora]
MKGGGGVSSYSFSLKRGWRGLVFAVLGLVILSMLVPLVFLLGLHNGFHSSSGFGSEDRTSSSTPNTFKSYDPVDQNNHLQNDESEHLDYLIEILEPSLTKDVVEHIAKGAANDIVNQDPMLVTVELDKGRPALSDAVPQLNHDTKNKEYKEEMKDATVKKIKDKLFVARAYFPTIAKLPTQDKLSYDMKQNIQEFERIFSESTTDADLPPHMQKRLEKMEALIAKAKTFPVDCNNVDKKLRQILDLTEDEAHFHTKQSAFLYQLAVQTIPKSHHCLSM